MSRGREHPPWFGPAWLVVSVTLATWSMMFVVFVLMGRW